MPGTDGSTIGSMLLWLAERCPDEETFMFWLNVYRGFREIEGTAEVYRFITPAASPRVEPKG